MDMIYHVNIIKRIINKMNNQLINICFKREKLKIKKLIHNY